jgi:BirA family biotin operon repressor/biotin-[acetyl-CoA-carboxylase] ligase
MFSQNDLQQGLLTHSFGKQLYIFDSLDSTNDYAKILASQGMAEGCVVITDHQNAGRGRMQRAWFDEPSSNLLLSLLIRPKIDAKQFNLLPFFAAISVALTIEQITGLSSSCKWPNDVLINGK